MEYAALVTWLVTAALGFVMLTAWVRNGGARAATGEVSHFRPPVVFGHFLLAVAGLVIWLVYLVNDSSTLAWLAFVVLLVVAAIGDTLVLRWYKDRKGAGGSTAGATGRGGPSTTTTGGDTLVGRAAGRDVALAEQRIPAAVVAAHGVFAVATLVLVLLTALEVGS
jgi:hypothetical protein